MINNSVNPINTPNNIIITDQSQTNVSVTQPVTTVLEVGAIGPQGQKGDTGPQGPQGDPGPQGPPGSLEAFEGIIVTGSSIFSGSTEFTTLPTIQVTGSFEVTGSASLNGYGLLTTAFTSSYNTFTASYYTDSSSFNTRVTNLEAFSSSLDATFATEAELNTATASLSSSISSLSSSFVSFSGSYNTGSFTGSFAGNGAGLTNIPASGIVGLNLSQIASGSATASISPTDGFRVNTNSTITGSLLVTNGISGSFSGSGANLFGIPASGIVGLNLSQIASGSATASISPTAGFRVNTNTIITGSLIVSGSSTLTNIGPAIFSGSLIVTEGITGSLLGTASYAVNALTASYALNVPLTASYATSASQAISSSYAFSASYAESSSQATSASYALSSSYATNASYSVLADTASFLPSTTNLNISSITASNAYFQSASIGFLQTVTGSATVIGDAFIILNTATPASRYAGIIVEDSGSNPVDYTASFFFDSVTNDWNYEYSSSTVPNFGVALFGPEYLTKGSPSYPTVNVLQKGNGGHHLLDSSITDDGTTVTISASVVITGSLQATGGISGSFSGSGANLFNIPASGITGLNLSQIATGSVSASVSPGTASFVVTSGSSTLLFVSSSGRVGIGTGNPLYPLDVNGTVRVSGSGIILSSPPATTISISKEHIGGGSTSTNLNWVYDTLYVSNSSTGNLFFFNGYYGTVSVRTNTGQTVNAFGIKGLGTTSATNALQVYNSAESSIFIIKDSGNVGIGITTPTSSLHVAGTTIISSSASTSSAALQIYKSGSTVLNVEGSSGQLFSVTDSLTGSLFSVNTVAGLPVIEAFSDNTVNIGKYGVYPIKVAATGTLAVITGSFTGSLAGVSATASYVNPLTQSVSIRGTGTTSATTALSIQNAGATSSLIVFDNGFVGIGTGSAAYNLDVNGGAFNNAFRVTGIARFTGASNSTGVYIENGLQIGSTISLGPFTFAPYMNITANSVSTNWGTVSFNTNNINAGEPSIILTSSPTNKGFTLGSTISGSSWATMKYFYDDGSMILQYTASSIDRVTSSIFTLNTTTRGFLPPRTNLTSNISTPAQGLITYITASSTEGLYYYNSGSFQSWTKVLNSIGTQTITGSLSITGSAGTGSALTVYKSGSTVVSIQGSQGELFSITDSLSGSLFSVSNISGLPILEVFSDNTTLIGNYLDPMLITTQLVTANSGSTTIYSLPTASYDGAFYDYVVRSGSNARAGQIMAIWSGSSVNYTDNSTTDFGSTANLSFNVIVSGSNMVLRSTVTTGSWTIKTIIRSI